MKYLKFFSIEMKTRFNRKYLIIFINFPSIFDLLLITYYKKLLFLITY